MNNPNTVLATGSLEDATFIVGTGNKGVKSFNPGARQLFITDAEGKAAGFSYGTPNKTVATDAQGNLILVDTVEPWNFFQFGGSQNPISRINITGSGSAAISSSGRTNFPNGASVLMLSRSDAGFGGLDFEIEFTNSLVLSTQKTVKVCAQVMTSFLGLENLVLGGSQNVTLVNGSMGSADTSGAGLATNMDIIIPAGTYNKLYFNGMSLVQNFSEQAVLMSCLFAWQ